MLLEVPDLLAQAGQVYRCLTAAARFVGDDLGFLLARRVVELDGNEALPGGVLQILQRALVARVVGNHQQEPVSRLDHLPQLLDREQPAVVGQRVDEDRRVLPRLDHFVEVADGANLDRAGQRPIHPVGAVRVEQVAANQVARRQVLVAGDGDERHAVLFLLAGAGGDLHHRPAELVGHVLDEAGLAGAGGAFQQHRDALGIGRLEELHFIRDREVVRLFVDRVFLHGVDRRIAEISLR